LTPIVGFHPFLWASSGHRHLFSFAQEKPRSFVMTAHIIVPSNLLTLLIITNVGRKLITTQYYARCAGVRFAVVADRALIFSSWTGDSFLCPARSSKPHIRTESIFLRHVHVVHFFSKFQISATRHHHQHMIVKPALKPLC
jgi:hypothetical protein